MDINLEELPNQIAAQERVVSLARQGLDTSKLKLRVKAARQRLRMKALKLDSTEKTAKITIDTEQDEMNIIQLEADLREEEIHFRHLTNQFLSVRKQTAFSIAEMQNLG